MKTTYSIQLISKATGKRVEITTETSKTRAIAKARLTFTSASYAEVVRFETGVLPHCIFQSVK